jgi:hypothetical protein
MKNLMNVNDQHRSCHAERSEASGGSSGEMLRCAQHDRIGAIPVVKGAHWPIMNFHEQDRSSCHSERSEASGLAHPEMLRCAQNDIADLVREGS